MDAKQKDKLKITQTKVDQVKSEALENIQNVLKQGKQLEELQSRVNNLQRFAETFERGATNVSREAQKDRWFLPVCFFILLAFVVGIALPILGYPALGGLILGSFLTNPPLWAIVIVNTITFGAAAAFLSLVVYPCPSCECTESLPSICPYSKLKPSSRRDHKDPSAKEPLLFRNSSSSSASADRTRYLGLILCKFNIRS